MIEFKKYISKSMTYIEYRKLIDDLMLQNKTTGTDQSEDMVAYAKLNQQRMQRLDKTVVLADGLKLALDKIKKEISIIFITEGWCGDAAQNSSVFWYIEKYNPKIKLHLVLRDENLELIDSYLTNGGRAIPKVIFIDTETNQELAVWGPRPEAAQSIMLEMKEKNASLKEKAEAIHGWYGKDKTQSQQKELEILFSKL